MIDEEVCNEYGITLVEAIALYAIEHGISGLKEQNIIKVLSFKKHIRYVEAEPYPATKNKVFKMYSLTGSGKRLLHSIIMGSSKIKEEWLERCKYLAEQLREIFPKGKKDGTNYYWSDGVSLVMRRLNTFFLKYGDSYTDAQILNAARQYVEGFNGNYRYMRLLKYFIFKESLNANNEVEGGSELLTYIENEGQEDTLKDNWTSTLK